MSLKNAHPFTSFSVTDLEKALSFYRDILEIAIQQTEFGVLQLNLDTDHAVMIYPKADHQPATYTVLNFSVEDISGAVDALAPKGIDFLQYGPPLKTNDKGIATMEGGPSMAWFKDPSGNILSLIEGM